MKKRILASVLVLVMLICLLPVTAIADENEGWKVDGQTVMIYNAEGLRAWAASITNGKVTGPEAHGYTGYDGFTVSIENDIDLSDAAWTSIIGLGGTITIDGKGHTISNMRINEQGNGKGGNTYLGFIGDIAYGTRLTIKNITFENAHVQDLGGDSQYSWCGVVVGHGPMDEIGKAENSECTFRNVTVKNSVVTGGHNSAAILGYACSTAKGHLFENCHVLNTFVGGYASTSAVLFSMGHANVTVKDCSASKVRLYSDGLTFDTEQTVEEQWLGYLYEGVGVYEGENTADDSRIVYPVVFHYTNTDKQEYVQVNTPLTGTWYAEEACTTPVTQIIGSTGSDDMYPKGSTTTFENKEPYETQDTKKVDNPWTHGVIHLYTKEKYVPEQPTTDYLIPGLWLNTNDHYSYLIGYSDGTFRPDAPISRAEFAKIAVSFTQNNGSAVYNYFTDVKTTDWFAPYVTAAKDAGLIEGYSDGSFKPESKITRAEACAIVNRTLGRKPSKAHMKISDRIDWPDVQTTDWFYEAIMEATNSHTYQMGKRVETWNDKLPQRDWAALETGWANAYTGNGGEVR